MKPILFNTPMSRAVADNLKTATRRIANINAEILCGDGEADHEFVLDSFGNEKPTGFVCRRCGFGVAPPYSRVPCGSSIFRPRYWPGDILYVRENWAMGSDILGGTAGPLYMAEFTDEELEELRAKHFRWKPSIHMPAEAARLFLKVTNVRVERLQAMTEADARKEGVFFHPEMRLSQYSADKYDGPFAVFWKTALEAFRFNIWDDTIPKDKLQVFGWDANPWVWVYEFERCEKPKEEL